MFPNSMSLFDVMCMCVQILKSHMHNVVVMLDEIGGAETRRGLGQFGYHVPNRSSFTASIWLVSSQIVVLFVDFGNKVNASGVFGRIGAIFGG